MKTSAALLVIVLAVAPSVPVEEPAPTCSVPAAMVSELVKLLVPSRISVSLPEPDFVSVPETRRPVTFLSVPRWSVRVSSG